MNRIKTILSLALASSLLAAPALAEPRQKDATQAEKDHKKNRKAQHQRRGARHFKKMDSNGDGQLSKDEAMKSTDVRFSQVDSNGDRVITKEEAQSFAAAKSKKRGNAQAQDARFSRMDKNGDGKLTLTEARQAAGARFAKMDANGDDVVTKEEARMAMNEHRKGHQAKGQAKRSQ